jgi:hypothetical protein
MGRLYWRRDDSQLLHGPPQVADEEAASGTPERFAFRQRANLAQTFCHDAAGGWPNINANPLRLNFRAATSTVPHRQPRNGLNL